MYNVKWKSRTEIIKPFDFLTFAVLNDNSIENDNGDRRPATGVPEPRSPGTSESLIDNDNILNTIIILVLNTKVLSLQMAWNRGRTPRPS